MPPDPSSARVFGAPWTFTTVRTPRKMHATPLNLYRLDRFEAKSRRLASTACYWMLFKYVKVDISTGTLRFPML